MPLGGGGSELTGSEPCLQRAYSPQEAYLGKWATAKHCAGPLLTFANSVMGVQVTRGIQVPFIP